MTKQECAAARKVMEAWENGIEIEFKDREFGSEWRIGKGDLIWDWGSFEYRIKPSPPKPLEIYQWVRDTPHGPCLVNPREESLAGSDIRKILFREVLNEGETGGSEEK